MKKRMLSKETVIIILVILLIGVVIYSFIGIPIRTSPPAENEEGLSNIGNIENIETQVPKEGDSCEPMQNGDRITIYDQELTCCILFDYEDTCKFSWMSSGLCGVDVCKNIGKFFFNNNGVCKCVDKLPLCKRPKMIREDLANICACPPGQKESQPNVCSPLTPADKKKCPSGSPKDINWGLKCVSKSEDKDDPSDDVAWCCPTTGLCIQPDGACSCKIGYYVNPYDQDAGCVRLPERR